MRYYDSYDYLSNKDIHDLDAYHKKAGYKRFHSTRLYIPVILEGVSRYAIYSYYTFMGYVDTDDSVVLLREDYDQFSITTTRNVNRFIKENPHLELHKFKFI